MLSVCIHDEDTFRGHLLMIFIATVPNIDKSFDGDWPRLFVTL